MEFSKYKLTFTFSPACFSRGEGKYRRNFGVITMKHHHFSLKIAENIDLFAILF